MELEGGSLSMKIFVANLKSDRARYDSICPQLVEIGFDWEIIDAIDGRLMSAQEYERVKASPSHFEEKYGRPMLPAELGCSLSHLKMYREFLKSEHDFAVFLEDDACLMPGFKDVVLALAEKKYEFVILGYPARSKFEVDLASWIDPIYKAQRVIGGFKVGRSTRKKFFGSVGVFMSRQAAKKILELNSPVTTLADDHQLFALTVDIYHLRPFVVMENLDLQSSIHRLHRDIFNGISTRKKISRILQGAWLRVRALVCILQGK